MLRFSIREILLLAVVVGLGFGWWVDSRRVRHEATTLREKLQWAQAEHEAMAIEMQATSNSLARLRAQQRTMLLDADLQLRTDTGLGNPFLMQRTADDEIGK